LEVFGGLMLCFAKEQRNETLSKPKNIKLKNVKCKTLKISKSAAQICINKKSRASARDFLFIQIN